MYNNFGKQWHFFQLYIHAMPLICHLLCITDSFTIERIQAYLWILQSSSLLPDAFRTISIMPPSFRRLVPAILKKNNFLLHTKIAFWSENPDQNADLFKWPAWCLASILKSAGRTEKEQGGTDKKVIEGQGWRLGKLARSSKRSLHHWQWCCSLFWFRCLEVRSSATLNLAHKTKWFKRETLVAQSCFSSCCSFLALFAQEGCP